MKRSFLFFAAIVSSQILLAQLPVDISTTKSTIIDDVEYGFIVNNESTKGAGGKDMSRYEVTLYAKNSSNCLKMFLFEKKTFLAGSTSAENDLVRFDCVNATGQRLTSKGGTVEARPFYTNAKVSIKGNDGKTVVQDLKVQIGYALKPGESVSKSVIFLVPLGEQPKIQVRPIFNPPTF